MRTHIMLCFLISFMLFSVSCNTPRSDGSSWRKSQQLRQHKTLTSEDWFSIDNSSDLRYVVDERRWQSFDIRDENGHTLLFNKIVSYDHGFGKPDLFFQIHKL